MCGIAGFYLNIPKNVKLIEKMTSQLHHRGPDDYGFFAINNNKVVLWKEAVKEFGTQIALGHRRLSIIDLSTLSSQPMSDHWGRFWIIFNGEIYNYIELKQELKNVFLKTRSDTEVLVNLLAQKGLSALNLLNGIFAFALYDTQKKILYLVRDQLGIKPLYYFINNDGIYFASEIKPLLEILGKPIINHEIIPTYLMSNWVPEPETLFKSIKKLEPGHFLAIDESISILKEKYWDLEFKPHYKKNWKEVLNGILTRTIERQLRSDVPIGFFLSGGLDSSLLAAKACKDLGLKIATFTTGFEVAKKNLDDDLYYSRLVAKSLQTEHHEIVITPDITQLLPKVVDTLEEPLADTAPLCSYLICEEASKRFKVLISGQGADELFGGYPTFQAGWVSYSLRNVSPSLRRITDIVAKSIPYSFAKREFQTVHRLRKIINASSVPWPETYFHLRSPFRIADLEILINSDLKRNEFFKNHLELSKKMAESDIWHQMMFMDIKTYLPSLNLNYSDKTSMAHSIELRVPFLDQEIVNLVTKIPSEEKITLRASKIILKKVASSYLPKKVIKRRKTGFGLPIRNWLRGELSHFTDDLLRRERLKKENLFVPEVIHRWIIEHKNKKADHTMKLYNLISLEVWIDRFEVSI